MLIDLATVSSATSPIATFAQSLLDVGAITGLILLPYSFIQALRTRPRLTFSFAGRAGDVVKEEGREDYYSMRISGTLKNISEQPTSIVNLYLVVWHPKYHNATLRFGFNPSAVTNEGTGQTWSVPFRLDSYDAIKLAVKFDLSLQGTADAQLLREYQPIAPGSPITLPKYEYQLVFEDVHGNFFDEAGRAHSKEEIDLRWTLENTFRSLKEGNPLPYVWHILKIWCAGLRFKIRRCAFKIGLWH